MKRVAAFLMAMALPAHAGSVAEDAGAAAANLQAAVSALQAATGGQDSIKALTETIRAYELGQAALREALRQADARQGQLRQSFEIKRDSIAQLLGVLGQIGGEPSPALLIHPSGPLGAVRSGMMLADVTPALQREAEALRSALDELASLARVQAEAGKTLSAGLAAAQTARSDLSQAISDRTALPRRFTEDPEALRGLLQSADTLEAFAGGLALDAAGSSGFADAKGRLDMPALGTVVLRPGEVDAAGVARPGLTLATRAAALVTSPWAATIRYRGPLLDYGNVIVLEPGDGYLLILAGLQDVYGELGEVVGQGAALGTMGGAMGGANGSDAPKTGDLVAIDAQDGGNAATETLYIELRAGAVPEDPTEWFAGLGPAAME